MKWAAVAGFAWAGLSAGDAQAAWFHHTGAPNAVALLADDGSNTDTFTFFEDYIWNTDVGTVVADAQVTGPWAANTWNYKVFQESDVRNTIMLYNDTSLEVEPGDLLGDGTRVRYRLSVPLPTGLTVDTITVEASLLSPGGVVARVALPGESYYTHTSLFNSSSPVKLAEVPSTAIDLSTPGFATFNLQFEQEAGTYGYIDWFRVTATTAPIPEPAMVSVAGVMMALLAGRRRRGVAAR